MISLLGAVAVEKDLSAPITAFTNNNVNNETISAAGGEGRMTTGSRKSSESIQTPEDITLSLLEIADETHLEKKETASAYAYTYSDVNLLAADGNLVVKKVLDFLDVVKYGQYKSSFLSASLDEVKLQYICSSESDSERLDYFLTENIAITAANHREIISSMLQNLNKKSCLHLCVEKWNGQYICSQCYKYFNFDDGKAATDNSNHNGNLGDAVREAREREIEMDLNKEIVTRNVLDGITPDMAVEDLENRIGELSCRRGVPIGWLLSFTDANDCWEMSTQDVCRNIVFPALSARRCRYVELDHMKDITGPASTFISHCRGGTWGNLVAAVCDGDADRSRRVWIDIFACRQWPSAYPDLNFDSTIRKCSSFLLVCSPLKEFRDLDWIKVASRDITSLPKVIRAKIAFLRVWCLVELHTVICNKVTPIIMKIGSHKIDKMVNNDKKVTFVRVDDLTISNLMHLVDIEKAEATVESDKELILGNIASGAGFNTINSNIRSVIMSTKSFIEVAPTKVFKEGDEVEFLHDSDFLNKTDFWSRGTIVAVGMQAGMDRKMSFSWRGFPITYGGMDCEKVGIFTIDYGGKNDCEVGEDRIRFPVGDRFMLSESAQVLVENAVCGDATSLTQVFANPAKVLPYLFAGHYVELMRALGLKMISELLNNDLDLRSLCLIRACIAGYVEDINLILNEENGTLTLYEDKSSDYKCYTPLMIACICGQLEVVKYLVAKGVDVNALNSTVRVGGTALIFACEGGHIDIVKFLVVNNAIVNKHTSDCFSPLMAACRGGHLNVVKYLCDNGSDLNTRRSFDGRTALALACRGGFIDTVRLLIDRGVDINLCAPIVTASTFGHLDIVQLLIENGCDVNLNGWVGGGSASALFMACFGMFSDIMMYTRGSPSFENSKREISDQKEKYFNTYNLKLCSPPEFPISSIFDYFIPRSNGAVSLVHFSIVRLLVDNNADINVTDFWTHFTPLMFLCRGGHTDAVRFLVEKCARVNARTVNGETSLKLATKGGFIDIVRLLVEKGACVNDCDERNETILMMASRAGNIDMVRFLIEKGADVNARAKNGMTSLILASIEGNIDLVRFLLNNGAAVQAKTDDGETSLIMASQGGFIDIVRLLVDSGADVNARTIEDRKTSLFMANQGGFIDIVRLLVDSGADENAKTDRFLLSLKWPTTKPLSAMVETSVAE